MRWLDGITDSMHVSLGPARRRPGGTMQAQQLPYELSHSVGSESFATPWTAAFQASLSFTIFNIGICWEPARESPPMTRSCGRVLVGKASQNSRALGWPWLMLEGIGGRRRRGCQRMRWLGGITDSMDVSLGPGRC